MTVKEMGAARRMLGGLLAFVADRLSGFLENLLSPSNPKTFKLSDEFDHFSFGWMVTI